MRTCNAESQKRSVKGSNFKEDDSAVVAGTVQKCGGGVISIECLTSCHRYLNNTARWVKGGGRRFFCQIEPN